MPHWSREIRTSASSFRRDSWQRDPFDDDSDSESSGPPAHRPVMIEERYPRRRGSSFSDWETSPRRHRPVVIEERRPRRRSSSIDDYPHHHRTQFYYPPILLPPSPSKPRRRSTKKKLYFVRPHDGHPEHRRGTIGRFEDALTGEGPDVFVTSSTRERLMRDRPQRWQWSGYGLDSREILTKVVEPEFSWREFEPVRETPWGRRGEGEGYDFRKRTYRRTDKEAWTDARWRAGARRGSWPERHRDGKFRWWDRVA